MSGQADKGVDEAALQRAVLAWYDAHARRLPWRVGPSDRAQGQRADAYRVWISEVMLQQTTAAAAGPRFERFLARFADVESLAAAPLEAVLQEWAGLGYYARARNLHAAARAIAAQGLPRDEAGWRALPGVGAYTAAAVAAIALEQPAAPVDANIERVLIRVLALPGERAIQKAAVRRLAAHFVPRERPGDWAQALMDLGAMLCTPRAPACAACPIASLCRARSQGPEDFPTPVPKAVKPRREGAAFWLAKADHVWLVRRPDRGLLAGMAALPSTPWEAQPGDALAHAPADLEWIRVGAIEHVFTHFALTLTVYRAESVNTPSGAGWWSPIAGIDEAGLPTVFRKAAECALGRA